ncbi:hypothetical protein HK405_000402, partial [Cladochytrium tenue]
DVAVTAETRSSLPANECDSASSSYYHTPASQTPVSSAECLPSEGDDTLVCAGAAAAADASPPPMHCRRGGRRNAITIQAAAAAAAARPPTGPFVASPAMMVGDALTALAVVPQLSASVPHGDVPPRPEVAEPLMSLRDATDLGLGPSLDTLVEEHEEEEREDGGGATGAALPGWTKGADKLVALLPPRPAKGADAEEAGGDDGALGVAA